LTFFPCFAWAWSISSMSIADDDHPWG
jgi:hypothetical protein